MGLSYITGAGVYLNSIQTAVYLVVVVVRAFLRRRHISYNHMHPISPQKARQHRNFQFSIFQCVLPHHSSVVASLNFFLFSASKVFWRAALRSCFLFIIVFLFRNRNRKPRDPCTASCVVQQQYHDSRLMYYSVPVCTYQNTTCRGKAVHGNTWSTKCFAKYEVCFKHSIREFFGDKDCTKLFEYVARRHGAICTAVAPLTGPVG